jgi:hypothetical protein
MFSHNRQIIWAGGSDRENGERAGILYISLSWTADGGRLFVVASDKVTQAPFISRRILFFLLLLYLRIFAFIKKYKRPLAPLRPYSRRIAKVQLAL